MNKRSREDLEKIKDFDGIITVLKTIHDPEVGLDIWNLELIYDIKIKDKSVVLFMTFTSPLCPYGPELVDRVKNAVESLGFTSVDVEVVLEPVWQPSEYVKELLGIA